VNRQKTEKKITFLQIFNDIGCHLFEGLSRRQLHRQEIFDLEQEKDDIALLLDEG
jgi:hypothetical protein